MGKPRWAAEGKRWASGAASAVRGSVPRTLLSERPPAPWISPKLWKCGIPRASGTCFLIQARETKNKTKIKAGKTEARKERKRKPAPVHLRLAPFRGLRGIRRKSESLVHVGMQITAKLQAWGRGPGGWPGLARTPATQAGQRARSSPATTALKRSPQGASGTSNDNTAS